MEACPATMEGQNMVGRERQHQVREGRLLFSLFPMVDSVWWKEKEGEGKRRNCLAPLPVFRLPHLLIIISSYRITPSNIAHSRRLFLNPIIKRPNR